VPAGDFRAGPPGLNRQSRRVVGDASAAGTSPALRHWRWR
jgi:hypothetical protein